MILTAFCLKIIAVAGMILQHTALALPNAFPLGVEIFLQISGGLTFPILSFLLVDGFRATSDLNKYITRMFIFGVISFVPHLFGLGSGLNILFTMTLSLYLLRIRQERGNVASFWVIFAALVLASAFLDWGIIGPIGVVLYDVIKNEKARRIVVPAFFAVAAFLQLQLFSALLSQFMADKTIAYMFFPIGSLLAIPLLLLYNGERGRSAKWFFYVIYPVHLAVLAVVSIAMGKNVIINMISDILVDIL